jgi:hypothetical protein
MTAQAANAIILPQGVNRANWFFGSYLLSAALASTETLTLTLPATVARDSLPFNVQAWHLSSGTLWIPYGPDVANRLVLTSHDRASGVTIMTAGSSGLAAGDKVLVQYVIN